MKSKLSDFLELDTTALLAVNGGSDCGGGYSPPSNPSAGGGSKTPTGGGGSGSGSGRGASGGGYCSGASDGKTIYANPYYKGGEKNSSSPGNGGGNCGNISGKNDLPQISDVEKNAVDDAGKLAKVADGIAYPVGDEYSDEFVVTDIFGPREPIETPIGMTEEKFHTGIDIAAQEGTRINSIGDGIVSEVGNRNDLGNYVVVTHPNGTSTSTRYAHCSEITTSVGSIVSAGQQIGCVGSTGWSTGSHLHLSYDGDGDGLYTNCEADNPNYLLSR